MIFSPEYFLTATATSVIIKSGFSASAGTYMTSHRPSVTSNRSQNCSNVSSATSNGCFVTSAGSSVTGYGTPLTSDVRQNRSNVSSVTSAGTYMTGHGTPEAGNGSFATRYFTTVFKQSTIL